MLLDTCHSGALNIAMRSSLPGEDLAQRITSASGTYLLSASKSGETSIEDSDYRIKEGDIGHGAFTYSILKGLSGDANFDNNEYLTISELFSYVANYVPRITNGSQHPYSQFEGTDVPIYIYK